MSFKRTKAQVHDLEDRDLNPAGLVLAADGAGGFYLAAGGGHATGSVVVYDEDTFIGVFDELRFIGSGVQVFNSGSYGAVAITGSAAAPAGGGSGSMASLAYFSGSNYSTRTYTADSTWETDHTGSITVDRDCFGLIDMNIMFNSANNNWEYYQWRLLLDGVVQTGSYPWGRQQNVGKQANEVWHQHQSWYVFLASGTHIFVHQNYDGGSGNDRTVQRSFLQARVFPGRTGWINFG